MQTHETFIQSVAALAKARVTPQEQATLDAIKLVYGSGPNGVRGVTYFKRWQNGQPEPEPFVEVCAGCEESWIQLAGTTIHELAHVLAGFEAGHGKAWKEACAKLGLRRAHAAGQSYALAAFCPDIRNAIAMIEKPADGKPVSLASLMGGRVVPKPCTVAVGSKGGTSRGTGAGSRYKKIWCASCGYTLRGTRAWLAVAVPACPNPACSDHGKPMVANV